VSAASAAWVEDLRREGAEHLQELGLPTTRMEDWRYTNVSAIAKTSWTPGDPRHDDVSRTELERLCFPVFACHLFVFTNGIFAADLSTPRARGPQVEVHPLARVLEEEPEALRGALGAQADAKTRAFTAWNQRELRDGAVVRIPEGTDLEEPIHLVFLAEPGAKPTVSHPRVLIQAGAGSRASVVEDYVSFGDGEFLTNAVTEIRLAPNAELEHVRLQREGDAGSHVSALHATLERDARLSCHAVTLGGGLVRNDAHVALLGEGAAAHLQGVFLGTGERHVDNHTTIDHAVPHTTSEELYKGVLDDRSRGVFHGRVIVRPDAQKTDAKQSSKNLLLSPGAEIDTKPQLEIHADDVKCSHGSTIGQMDPDALFYLRARGIGEKDARALLTRAFVSEATASLRFEPLRERIEEQLVELLEEGHE
jgi:Fe-S cluster assembly protein SufD